jgi:hypothetical protein
MTANLKDYCMDEIKEHDIVCIEDKGFAFVNFISDLGHHLCSLVNTGEPTVCLRKDIISVYREIEENNL